MEGLTVTAFSLSIMGMAALERNHHLPAIPRVMLVGVSLVLFLLLVCIGLLLDRIFGRAPEHKRENTQH